MSTPTIHVALLTGGQDRSYAVGLAGTLLAHGVHVEFIGSDLVHAQELRDHKNFRFLNLRGDQSEDARLSHKFSRLLIYYYRLILYGFYARPQLFHILWNNKFEFIDRTLLMLYYRLCGRRIVLTAHNVNAAARDAQDGFINRFSLWIQYHLCDHIFVHTEKMAGEMEKKFQVKRDRLTVIPFGINETVEKIGLSREVARQLLDISEKSKVALFFGQIAPYKGLDFLAATIDSLSQWDENFCVLIAGKVKIGHETYWNDIERRLTEFINKRKVLLHINYIHDKNIEKYFMAADVLVLPYVEIFQSGLPFLSYNFGLPIIVTDVGGLGDTVAIGETGFVCAPRDSKALERALRCFFASAIYREGTGSRQRITAYAKKRYSWESVGAVTRKVYKELLSNSEI